MTLALLAVIAPQKMWESGYHMWSEIPKEKSMQRFPPQGDDLRNSQKWDQWMETSLRGERTQQLGSDPMGTHPGPMDREPEETLELLEESVTDVPIPNDYQASTNQLKNFHELNLMMHFERSGLSPKQQVEVCEGYIKWMHRRWHAAMFGQ